MSTKATGNKNTLPLLIVLPLNMVSAVGKNFTQIACRINKDSSTISKEIRRHLFRVPHFQNETQRKRSECEHFQNCEEHICGIRLVIHLCWKCRPALFHVLSRLYSPDSAKIFGFSSKVLMTVLRYYNCDFYFYRGRTPTIFTVKQNLLHGLGLTGLLEVPRTNWTIWFPLCFCRDSLCPHIFASNRGNLSPVL